MPRKASAELDTNPPISLRLKPDVRAAVVTLAEKEHRNLSGQIAYLVEFALDQQGIPYSSTDPKPT